MTGRRGHGLLAPIVLAVLALGCGPAAGPDPHFVLPLDSEVEVELVDELGAAFVLQRLSLSIDWREVRSRSFEEGTSPPERVRLGRFPVPGGEREAVLELVYRGEGHGVFSYLKEYKFEVRSKHRFTVPPGGAVRLRATCYEKGGPTTPIEDRPTIRWEELQL